MEDNIKVEEKSKKIDIMKKSKEQNKEKSDNYISENLDKVI